MVDSVDSMDAVLVRAARLSDDGRQRAAIAVLESALESCPDHATAWCRLSAAYLDIGAPSESLTAAKRAIMLGERSWAHRLASLALVELGRHDEAVVSAGEAVRRDPEDWRGLVTLSEALARGEPEQAVRAARAAVNLAPDEARTHEVLGDAAMLGHDWTLAEQAYGDALRLDPDNPDVAAKLARLARRPAADPRRHRQPVRTRSAPTFGRVQRVAWYLAVRRAAVWQGVCVLVLLVASPVRLLGWVGLGVLLFVGVLGWRGWVRLPAGARVSARALADRAPLVVAGGVALGVSVVALLAWTVLLVLGSVVGSLLVVAFFAAVVAVANTWFGLWRMWARSR
jgi:tetratricopeptide (TPR) repeat protein